MNKQSNRKKQLIRKSGGHPCLSALLSLLISTAMAFAIAASVSFPADASLTAAVSPKTLADLFRWAATFFRSGYNPFISLLALIGGWLLYHRREQILSLPYARKPGLKIISLLFGILNTAGLLLFHLDSLAVFRSLPWCIMGLVLAAGYAGLFWFAALLFYVLWNKLTVPDRTGRASWIDRHLLLCCFCVILLCWLPSLIIYYPASMDWDVMAQLYAWRYEASNHHPWLGSCILGLFYESGHALGNDSLGIFLYVLTRSVLMALLFARVITLLRQYGIKRRICLLCLAFYALTPVWGAYAKHAFKDTLGIALFSAYLLTLLLVIRAIRQRRPCLRLAVWNGLAGLMAALIRGNFFYVIAPVSFVLLAASFVIQRRLRFEGCISFLCILFFVPYNYFFLPRLGVASGGVAEALSLPLQASARIVRDHGDELAEADRAALDEYLYIDRVPDRYDPILSDPIKDNCIRSFEDRGEKFSACLHWLLATIRLSFLYPVTALEALIGHSSGYYAFTPNRPIGAGNWNSGMTILYTINKDSYMSAFFPDFDYVKGFESARSALYRWVLLWDTLPVLSLTDMCALYTWLAVLIGYDLLKKKRLLDALPIAALLLVVLTCMASPVNDCFRYCAPVAASFPALLLLQGQPDGPDKSTKKARRAAVSRRAGILLSAAGLAAVACLILLLSSVGREYLGARRAVAEDIGIRHEVSVRNLAHRNQAGLTEAGCLPVDRLHPLSQGPGIRLHRGVYEITYDLTLAEADPAADALARLSVSADSGRQPLHTYELSIHDFDEQGHAQLTLRETLPRMMSDMEFLVFPFGDTSLLVNHIAYQCVGDIAE